MAETPEEIHIKAKIKPEYDWGNVKPGPLFVMPGSEDPSRVAWAEFLSQEWEGHVRRIANEVLEAEGPRDTYVKCGCGFEVTAPDGERAQSIMVDHDCFEPPLPGQNPPIPWHASVQRLLTNVIGWAAIASVAYLFFGWMLEP